MPGNYKAMHDVDFQNITVALDQLKTEMILYKTSVKDQDDRISRVQADEAEHTINIQTITNTLNQLVLNISSTGANVSSLLKDTSRQS